MIFLLWTVGAFALAAAVNSASVWFEQRRRWLSRRFGPHAWHVHLLVVTPPWLLFLVLQAQVGDHLRIGLSDALRPLGWTLALGAALLFTLSLLQLGVRRTLNGSFFESDFPAATARGVYRWLKNPMYHSYGLAFVAAALIQANAVYLVLAATSYVLLNVFEASIENRPLKAAV